jgi:hypothetical protein
VINTRRLANLSFGRSGSRMPFPGVRAVRLATVRGPCAAPALFINAPEWRRGTRRILHFTKDAWKNAMPSTTPLALSLVMTSCPGTSITCSMTFILRPISVDEGNHEIEARPQHSGVAAESFDGPVVALRHRLDAEEDRENRQENEDEDESVGAAEHFVNFPQMTYQAASNAKVEREAFNLQPRR